ncbi:MULTISPECIES: STAS domain-containing protein [Novosphingobium]|uniref:STAS domain-containing protein n=1 Tax=Novosphingobium decolorationis TaxID=2698673 RepID=A0ABX8E1D4_9SPHN|nr:MULTISPECIES: STAS domain-containing protein [Novosphingobium]QVM82733.1 STAS domain-containing protein [Novosphingobium decolorationis]GAM06608.1 hypothetical conserved protein [Novosphingobium sp. MBES04]
MQISVGDTATIRTIQGLATRLLEGFAALGPGEELELDTSQLDEADLSFVQLIEAARIQGAQEGKPLRLAHPANTALAALLARGGLAACADSATLAFWFHGDAPQ